jgi:hypothetical protein
MVPLLWLATTRHRNWIAKIHVSHKVMFHSATLVLVGLYLLFMASVGYYVRYFGGAWGGALQLGLVLWPWCWPLGWRCRVHCAPRCGCFWASIFFVTALITVRSG